MPSVYDSDLVREKGIQAAKLDTTIFRLMSSADGDAKFMAYGARFALKGTAEYEGHVNAFGEKLVKMRKTTEEVDATISRYRENPFFGLDTGFRAMRYHKRLVYDISQGVIGELHIPSRRVDVFRGAGLKNLLVDWENNAGGVMPGESLNTDYTFEEALAEFEAQGFTFNFWDAEWHMRYLDDNGNRTIHAPQITPVEGVRLADALTLVKG